MLRLLARALASIICLSSLAVCAEEAPPTATMPSVAGGSEPNPPEVFLGLDACVATALAKNFNVRIQAYSVSNAKDSVIIAQAAYDPILGVTWQKTFTKNPVATSSTQTAAGSQPTFDNQSTQATITQPLETGGTVTGSYQLARNQSNLQQALLNPAYDGTASINLIQPLLQGAGLDYGRATIEIARLSERIAGLNFKSTVLTTVFNVETAYYNVIYARRQYAVAQDSVTLAQRLLDENTIKRRTGVLTDLDVVQAQAGLATAQSLLIGYKQAMENSQDTLLQAMGERGFNKITVGQVDFPPLPSTDVSFDTSYKLARDDGPNLAIIDATIEQFKLDALRAKRNNLPQLNATGGGGYLSADHSYSRANDTVWDGPGYTWNAGLALSVPWGMRANRALYRQARANVLSEQVVYDQADQALVVQIRTAVRSIQANVQSVAAATQAAVLSQKQYDLQKAKFDAGLSTSYDVLQAQNLLSTARNTEIQAQVSLRVALADLRFLEGSSLAEYRINLN